MIQQETVSNLSRLTQLIAAHGVYALTVIFIFYQQWRAGKSLKDAKSEKQGSYFRKIHTSVVITTYILVGISTAVWIYATFFYTAKFYIRGSIAGLTKLATNPEKSGDIPKVMEDVSPESADLNLYTKVKEASSPEGKYDLGWVLFPPENMESVVFVLQHHYEIAQQRKLSLDPGSSPDSPERGVIDKKFKLDIRKIRSMGSAIQLMYKADDKDPVRKVGKIYLRNSEAIPVCLPWEEIAPDKIVARQTTSWLLPTVYASPQESAFKENGDYDPALGRILRQQLNDSTLKTQLLARDVLVGNGPRSFKFVRDTLKSIGPEDSNSLLVSNLGAAVLEIESDGKTTPRDIQLALAKSFYDVGDNKSSALFFDKAGDGPLGSADFYYYRGWVYYKTEQYNKAAKSLEQFIAKGQSPYAQSVAHTVLGMNYGKSGRYQNAAVEYKKAISFYPKFAAPYNNLAYLYADHGSNLDTALSLVNQALALETGANELAHEKDTKAWVLYKMGRCKEALPFIQEAAATLTTDADIKKHLEMLQKTKPCN